MRRFLVVVFCALFSASCSGHSIASAPPWSASPSVVQPDLTTDNIIETFLIPGIKPQVLAGGADGNVWFTEVLANIDRITPTGTVTQFRVHTGSTPCWIAQGPGTDMLVADNTTVIDITSSGTMTVHPLPSGDEACGGVALGPDGNFWYTDPATNSIGKMTPSGVVTEYPLPTPQADPYGGIVAGADGALWFVEEATFNVGRITTAGSITEFALGTNQFPTSIVAATDGNLYVGGSQISRVTTAGVITNYASSMFVEHMTEGSDKRLWVTDGYYVGQFDIRTDQPLPRVKVPRGNAEGLAPGSDRNVWFGAFGGPNGYMYVVTPSITTIGVRLNGELSFNDPNYGFELGYAKGSSTTTQTISVRSGGYLQFENFDTIDHTASFLGDATRHSAPWPGSFSGGMTPSPALTAIGTTGFSSGTIAPGTKSLVYATGMPGFYMIGCGFHYNSNQMRTVVIVR